MSSRNTQFVVTVRRSTELGAFYVGQTTTGLVSVVGTITDMENPPKWMEATNLTGILTGPESYMKGIVEGIIAQYNKQVAQGITDPVVDVVVEIGTKYVPMPVIGVNPSDGEESANLILQGFDLVGIERGTSVTMSEDAMTGVISRAQIINDERSVRAYEKSMARRVSSDVARVASSKAAVNKPAPIGKAL